MLWESKNPIVKAAGYVLVWLTPNCQEMTRLMSQEMEEPLSWHKRLMVRWHFLVCDWCARFEKHIRFLREAAVRYEPSGLKLSAEAKARIKQQLK